MRRAMVMTRINHFSEAVWAVGRAKALAFGIAVTVALLCGLLVMARPAHAATFTLNSTGDAPAAGSTSDGVCQTATTGECTLRAAIQEANGTTGTDIINFAIPGNGPHTITPNSALPTITQTVTIDGYTQGDTTATLDDDATENTLAQGTNAVLKIEINGTNPQTATVSP